MVRTASLLVVAIVTAGLAAGCRPSESRGANTPPVIVYQGQPKPAGSSKAGREARPADQKPAAGQADGGTTNGDSGSSSAKKPIKPGASTTTVTIRDFIRMLRDQGISATDRTDTLAPEYKQAFVDSTSEFGSSNAAVIGVSASFNIIAVEFKDPTALEVFLRSPPDLLLLRNLVVVPATKPGADWEMVRMVMTTLGGKRIEPRVRQSAALLKLLEELRGHLRTYKRKEGRFPDLKGMQWKQLTKAHYIGSPPCNSFSPESVCERIESVSTPGAGGEAVSFDKAGWVWNTADQQLYAAGISETRLKSAMDGAPGGKHFIATPDVHVTAGLNTLREAIDAVRIAKKIKRQPGAPFLEELKAELDRRGQSPVNPMNRSSEIQVSQWDPEKPPASGEAGWNYDPSSGRVWANTKVVGENKF